MQVRQFHEFPWNMQIWNVTLFFLGLSCVENTLNYVNNQLIVLEIARKFQKVFGPRLEGTKSTFRL